MKNFDSEGHAERMQTEKEEKTAHLRPLDCLTQVLLPLLAVEETLQRAAGLPAVLESTQPGTVWGGAPISSQTFCEHILPFTFHPPSVVLSHGTVTIHYAINYFKTKD